MTDEEILLAAGFDAIETQLILTGGRLQWECAEYVLKFGSGPEDERALAVVRRLMGKVEV